MTGISQSGMLAHYLDLREPQDMREYLGTRV
jgi:hypothetical protein